MNSYFVFVFVLVTLAVIVTGDEVSLRAALQSEILKVNPVCQEIKNSDWWKDRKKRGKNLKRNFTMDGLCAIFDDDPDTCRNVTEVKNTQVRCEVVGAKSSLCKGNLCNYLNDGSCTLGNTNGECVWFNKDWVTEYNAFWGPPAKITNQKGCFRNPCNMPGKNWASPKKCSALSVPGLYTCSWCRIPGQGMGCQMVEARGASSAVEGPPAECAWALSSESNQIYAKGHTNMNGQWIWKDGGKCQCDGRFTFCESHRKYTAALPGVEAHRLWPTPTTAPTTSPTISVITS